MKYCVLGAGRQGAAIVYDLARFSNASEIHLMDQSINATQSIKDRKNLSANGYLEVTIMITPKGNIHKDPIFSFRGIPVDDKDEFVYGLVEEIEKISKTFKIGSKQQEHSLIDALKIACRKFSKERTGKKPFTNINLVRI